MLGDFKGSKGRKRIYRLGLELKLSQLTQYQRGLLQLRFGCGDEIIPVVNLLP